MNPVWPALRRALDDLEAAGAQCALVGGLAAGARTEPRFTRDVDLAVSVAGDSDAEGVVRRLVDCGYRLFQLVEQESAERLATARLVPPGDGGSSAVVDLLFASSGIEQEIVTAAETLRLGGGIEAPVATIGHLVAVKLLAVDAHRPHDELDLHQLRQEASGADVEVAREAVALIQSRGFPHGRDLTTALDKWVARGA